MYDFFKICTTESEKRSKKKQIVIAPKFVINNRSKDLMIRGSDFYAVWDEVSGLWSTDEGTVTDIVDREIRKAVEEAKKKYELDSVDIIPKYMWDADSGSIDKWHKYVQKQSRDRYHQLDQEITFQNTDIKKESYASKKLPYPIVACEIPAYDRIMSTLYSEEERRKIEWAIGAIISGDSKRIQKFIVLYGSAGTGKSTVLNIIQEMFDGYYAMFDAKSLASTNNDFALEDFKSNPLVAIQHDGDLSKIADNTKLNSIVSHETMVVNEKFKSKYTTKFNSFIFMGTNKPVKITEAKSGLLRRLIDVRPTGEKIPYREYNKLIKTVKYELGGIAAHCLELYEDLGDDYYNNYVPLSMMAVTNEFYDFVDSELAWFIEHDTVALNDAWAMYKLYRENEKLFHPHGHSQFKEELKNYYKEFRDRGRIDGKEVRSVYSGFKLDMFMTNDVKDLRESEKKNKEYVIDLKEQPSIFDSYCSNCPAQYASTKETPSKKWESVETKLSDIDTSMLHYVKVPENHIVIDFDIKNESGEKDPEKNLKEASKFPPTYSELSKGGNGIHLHYIYDGDVSQLSRVFKDNVEIKVFTGNSSLRRRLTKCNSLPISHITSGLPLKEQKPMVNHDIIKTEKQLRSRIEKCLKKEHHGATAPEVDFIKKILDDAYASGFSYDLSDMRQVILIFAGNSTHQAQKCIKTVGQMHFKSEDNEVEEISVTSGYLSDKLVFFDVETFPNFFGICWKFESDDKVNKMFNPSAAEVAHLTKYKLVGFNNRKYDNHILYARMQGFSNKELYDISRRIIDKGDTSAFFREAYNLSYTDIYDFASAANKKGLKKWEIELGIHHQELGLKWDEPVPEELWPTVMDYCANDVIATEAVFKHLSADFEAREILSSLTGLSVNDTTNQHTTYLIVGNDRNPQRQYVYTDLSEMFPGYVYENGVSTYKGVVVGEGGYVYSEPGMYRNVTTFDIASMHPSSAIALNIFGPYTKNFEDLVKARLYIKHGEYDKAGELFDGKLKPFLKDKKQAKSLSGALKTAINSVYGLTAAHFDHKLRDPRNVDNIVAKRGALFMVDLKEEVQKRGYTVAHIKTDSIKIPNADKEIENFIFEFGKQYGYTFEIESVYNKICLVNNSVYIAKEKDGGWTATGAQFAVPYVFKTLFSKEAIKFEDKCETKSVQTAMYLDMNEGLEEDEHNYIFIGKTGLFCPIKEGCGGGVLVRDQNGKYNSVNGAKGYRWLEAETVKQLGKEDDIDIRYYQKLVDDAIKTISKYGDVEEFIYS